ncbi:hypothetical protein D3C76_1856790 [compost metagenome]
MGMGSRDLVILDEIRARDAKALDQIGDLFGRKADIRLDDRAEHWAALHAD